MMNMKQNVSVFLSSAFLTSVVFAAIFASMFASFATPVFADYCTPQWMSSYSCDGNYRTQLYQNPDCTQTWYNMEYCQYGCSGGNCQEGPIIHPYIYPYHYYSGCAASVSLTTPADVYQGDFVSTTASITNIGDSSGTVNVNAYLCRADGTNCEQIYCGNSLGTSVSVPAHSAVNVVCGVRTGYDGYDHYDRYNYYSHYDYHNLPYTDPTIQPIYNYNYYPYNYGPVDGYHYDYNYDYYCDGTYYSNYQLNPCYYNYQYYPYNYNYDYYHNVPTGSYRIRVDWSGCGISDPTMYTGSFAILPYSACASQYFDDYMCDGSWKQQRYQGSDCSTTYKNTEFCQFGCSSGVCNPKPATTTTTTTVTTSTTSVSQAPTATTTIIYVPTWPTGLFSRISRIVSNNTTTLLVLLLLILLVILVILLSEGKKRAWIPWRGDEEKFSRPVIRWE